MPTTAINTLTTGNGFLSSFNTATHKLYITAETDTANDFDQVTLQKWRNEGFDVTYIPYGSGGPAYTNTITSISKSLGVGDSFGIIAFGDAAAACLETFRKPTSRLCVLVAYYPTTVTDVHSTFPLGLKVLVHLAGTKVGVTRNAEILGLQGKRRTVTRDIPKGEGLGGMLKLAWPSYVYDGVEPGFAEQDLDEFDRVAERLAWSRSLDCVRKAFKTEVELERTWEDKCHAQFVTKDAEKVLATMVDKPLVNHAPTMTGGIGQRDLYRFYQDYYFAPGNPPSLRLKLLSRTIGADKVVDELFVTFNHTHEMSWMLPNIPPTNKHVEVVIVTVVTMRGRKLYREHVYWDQASVLLQLGLLDPKYIPPASQELDIEELPIAGAESARKVRDEYSEPSNEMMDDW